MPGKDGLNGLPGLPGQKVSDTTYTGVKLLTRAAYLRELASASGKGSRSPEPNTPHQSHITEPPVKLQGQVSTVLSRYEDGAGCKYSRDERSSSSLQLLHPIWQTQLSIANREASTVTQGKPVTLASQGVCPRHKEEERRSVAGSKDVPFVPP